MIRYLSDKENESLEKIIESVVEEERANSEGIFINIYRADEVDHIDIQCIKSDICSKEYMEVPCSIKNIVISRIYIPSILLSYDMNYYREHYDVMNLSNGEVVMDREDNKYKSLSKEAKDFGFGIYENNIKIYPPLNIKKVKRIK